MSKKKLVKVVADVLTPVNRIDMSYKDVTARVPELTEAARRVQAGRMTQSEYAALVNALKPVKPYEFIPKPATVDEAIAALTSNKRGAYGKTADIGAGEMTDLRLDIPAYSQHGVWVNSIHRKGAPTVYGATSSVTDATMIPSPEKAMKVATGETSKAPFAVIRGGWNPMDEAFVVEQAQKYLKHKDWRQVGYDPERHGYFYDRETMSPIVSADEVIQIGPLVLAKKPKYGDPEDFPFRKGGAVNKKIDEIIAQAKQGPVGGYAPLRTRTPSQYEKDFDQYLAAQQEARQRLLTDRIPKSIDDAIAKAAGLVEGGAGALFGYGAQLPGMVGDLRELYEEYKPEGWADAPEWLKRTLTTEQIQDLLTQNLIPPEIATENFKAGTTGGNIAAIAEGVASLPQAAKVIGAGVGKGVRALAPTANQMLENYMLKTGQILPVGPKSNSWGKAGEAISKVAKEAGALKAHTLAQERAALPVQRRGLGLPPNNTAEQRAAAMGINTDSYHGTKQDITGAFRPGYDDNLLFVTKSPEFANNWIGKGKLQERSGEQAQQEVKSAENAYKELKYKMMDYDSLNKLEGEAFNAEYDKRNDAFKKAFQEKIGLYPDKIHNTVYPLKVEANKTFNPESDMHVMSEFFEKNGIPPKLQDLYASGNYLLYETKPVVDYLKSKGYDSMRLRESTGDDFPTIAVFNPETARSRFAAFDPWRINAATAALMGVAAPDLLAKEKNGGPISLDAMRLAVDRKAKGGVMGAAGLVGKGIKLGKEMKAAAAAREGVPDLPPAMKEGVLGKMGDVLSSQTPPMTPPTGSDLPLMPRSQGMYPQGVEQRDLQRQLGRGGKYTERMEDLLKSRSAKRKTDELIRKGDELGMREWYGTEPLRVVAMNLGIDPKDYERFMAHMASASQRNPVDKQNQMGSLLWYLENQGKLTPESVLLTNKLKRSGAPAGADLVEFPAGYGSLAQSAIFDRAKQIAAGDISGALPEDRKLGTFYRNLLGNLRPVTVDVNAVRGPIITHGDPRWLETQLVEKDELGNVVARHRPREAVASGEMSLKEAKDRPGFWLAAPEGSEYAGFEKLWQRAAERAGVAPAEAQAMGWYGSADVTALKTKPELYVDNLERLIRRTAEQTGKRPMEVMEDMLTGKGFLRKKGGAVKKKASGGLTSDDLVVAERKL